MAQSRVLAGLVSSLILLVLITGCGAFCSKEELLSAELYRSQTLSSFNYTMYTGNVNCGWRIKASGADEVVQLQVVSLHLKGDYECSFDSLSIYDSGGPYSDQRLAILCGADYNRKPFYSTGRDMYIHFKSVRLETGMGFELQYSAVKRWGVSTTTQTVEQGVKKEMTLYAISNDVEYLSSPGYPFPYHSHERYVWTIWCLPHKVIHLHVEEMDLQTLANCGRNTVIVYDSSSDNGTELATMCNVKYKGADLYSTEGVLVISFTSGIADYGKGFKLSYKAVSSTEVKRNNAWSPGPDSSSNDDGSITVSHDVWKIVIVSGGLLNLAVVCLVIGVFIRNTLRPPTPGRISSLPISVAGSSSMTLDNQHHGYDGPASSHPEDVDSHPEVPVTCPDMAALHPGVLASHADMAANQPSFPASHRDVPASHRDVPASLSGPADSGLTHPVFSSDTEEQPTYSSLQRGPRPFQPDSAVPMLHPNQLEITPSSYTESVRPHPPRDEVVHDHVATPTQSVAVSVPLLTSELTAAIFADSGRYLESAHWSTMPAPNNGAAWKSADEEPSAEDPASEQRQP